MFAIVELMRAVAAFMIAPIFVHLAANVGGGLDAGTGIALWIGLGLALGGRDRGADLRARAAPVRRPPRSTAFVEGDDSGLVLAAAPGAGARGVDGRAGDAARCDA